MLLKTRGHQFGKRVGRAIWGDGWKEEKGERFYNYSIIVKIKKYFGIGLITGARRKRI